MVNIKKIANKGAFETLGLVAIGTVGYLLGHRYALLSHFPVQQVATAFAVMAVTFYIVGRIIAQSRMNRITNTFTNDSVIIKKFEDNSVMAVDLDNYNV